MRKRRLIIAGGILIVVVITATIYFILNTESTLAPTVDLNGTWCVYQYAENRQEDEFIVFQDGMAADYRGENEELHIKSAYTYNDGKLVLTDVEKEFIVRVISENNIIMLEPDGREWKMIKVANGDRNIANLTVASIVGKYNVVRVAGSERTNEMMIFTDTSFKNIRNGNEFMSCEYELVSSQLMKVEEISKEYIAYKNGDVLLLIDKADWYVWELILE